MKDPKTLHLVLKRKWFDMIRSGEKKEEYREPRYYWYRRLLNVDREGYGHFCESCDGDFEDLFRAANDSFYSFTQLLQRAIEEGIFEYKDFEFVQFQLDYYKDAPRMTFEIDEIFIGKGREDWGAEPDKLYFVIKLGKRI